MQAQLKREGKQGANTQDDLHSQLSCLQSRLDAAEQVVLQSLRLQVQHMSV